ncbi:MarR family winged helix-turn-helix transcriptional regulator [Ammoniphilus sp. 3BR4]|uniref:MarR family winged helix-turn-helix transcriptional regulator n=1 Tax=Ammoniphilus sp. 3BR4 TaxID=3158265 RepID=UPI0034655132
MINDERKKNLLDVQEIFTALTRKATNEWNQLNQTDLCITHVLILQLLEERGPQRPTYLADELQITTGGITGLTNKLAKEDLIQRSMSEQDRRAIHLEITDRGRDILGSAIKQIDELTERLFGSLPDKDLRELRRILRVILKNL